MLDSNATLLAGCSREDILDISLLARICIKDVFDAAHQVRISREDHVLNTTLLAGISSEDILNTALLAVMTLLIPP